jgi:hypothetical protein
MDAVDELVIAVLEGAGRAKCWPLLPEVLALYRCYPTPKAKWMLLFGHPGKKRARPEMVKALRAALVAVTGRPFEDPEALEAFLGQPASADRVSGKKPRAKRAGS